MMMLAVVFANADAKWVSGDCQVEIIAPGKSKFHPNSVIACVWAMTLSGQ